MNNKTHGSEYNAEKLEDSLKADHHFISPNNSGTVVSNKTNDDTKVAEYFSEDAEQVNCEMYELNSAMKYGFRLLENIILTIAVDDNGLQIKLINSKLKCVSDIVTPGGAFTQDKELIKNLNSIAT